MSSCCMAVPCHSWCVVILYLFDVRRLALLHLSLVVTGLIFITARFLWWWLNAVNFVNILVCIYNSFMSGVHGARWCTNCYMHLWWGVLLLHLLLLLLHALRLFLTWLYQTRKEFLKLVFHSNVCGHLWLLWGLHCWSGSIICHKVVTLSLIRGGDDHQAWLLWLHLWHRLLIRRWDDHPAWLLWLRLCWLWLIWLVLGLLLVLLLQLLLQLLSTNQP